MPTLNFDGNFSAKERKILSRTFRSNCNELGISKCDCSVALRKDPIGSPRHRGFILTPEPDQFIVVLNRNFFNLYEAISTLGHEAVHIKQTIEGKLVDCEGGCLWNKNFIPREIAESEIFYDMLPWEQEATKLQSTLHKQAVHSLPLEDVKHVMEIAKAAIMDEPMRIDYSKLPAT
jgi:hypothetical protein